MVTTKETHILRSLRKISHKKWELFVVTRVLHGLDDDEVEFVTQQLVRRSDGSRALTDMYFPQFNHHLEVDEPHHNSQVGEDELRQQDIVQMTGHHVERITIPQGQGEESRLECVRGQVDDFIGKIKSLKETAEKERRFTPWDFDARYSADPVIERGWVAISDGVVFRTQAEALRCFGFNGKVLQRGGWVIPDGSHDVVWFPRLYRYGNWHNKLDDDGKILYERAVNEEGKISIKRQIADNEKYKDRRYVVFAKAKDTLGFNLLRYIGSFKMNFDQDKVKVDELMFYRVSDKEDVRVLPG